ncbi:exopolysaccharide biosynthesis polyisoprenyl-phosphate hexose-1-phosphate transferase EpsZ [Pyxidicoccus xibeiensis]|uniref:exopolysaccharide biosynthesis polyisoprenyl-phosphate hexose-1-phosphate transferase EpsZ n=1 Tax=Pyxidicoccus xibeiensis TaxID=2906759 RepID=UPI0020A7FB25|nr:exopolysaccharide biosynthesis polyisoprenyl-phosphate hexose-1-phosphate transferase EpsZ [Pyxidicoccus xibeiensis]MCP3137198.1 sugar transferase [Pyxidicoccus xibeiensis]
METMSSASASAAVGAPGNASPQSDSVEEVQGPKLAPGFAAKLNLTVDLILMTAVLGTASWLDGQLTPESGWVVPSLVLTSLMTWIITGTALCLYDSRFVERSKLDHVALVSVATLAVVTVLALVSLALPERVTVTGVAPLLIIFWPVALLLRLFVFRPVAAQERPMDSVLIVGTGAMGRYTGEDLVRRGRRQVLGYVRFHDDTGSIGELPARIMGSVEDLEHILRNTAVDEVYIAGNTLKQGESMQGAIKLAERFGVPFALPAHSFRLDRARPIERRAVSDGFLHFAAVSPKPHQMAMKRLFDICVSAVALWMLLPLLAFVALAVKLTSKGPIFFKQLRVGQNGKSFYMLKFRSMVVNAEELKAKLAAQNEMSGPVFKMKNDPRITGIGRFIRKFSIDELPQFINVLRGEMSIVGPRPPVPSEVAKYETWQRRRLSVRPGLTCIWQVSGRNQISFEEWMYLDMQYIDHWSLTSDLTLLLQTVPVVLTGRGAS